MAANRDLPSTLINSIQLNPVHSVLFDIGQAAVQHSVQSTEALQKLVAYIIELADGRDRREPWTNRPGVARPVAKLRVALEEAFGTYGDLQWFKVNKTTNRSGQPLLGLFPRMAASLSRVDGADFGAIVTALVSSNPDAALVRMLHSRDGRIGAARVQLFSRLAYAFRRDLYFVISSDWGERTGVLKYIDNDLRRYVAVCQRLRDVCDLVGLSADIRASVFLHLLEGDKPDPELTAALGRAIGPTLARYAVLEPAEAYEASASKDDQAANPLEFATMLIRGRRGDRKLRHHLRKVYSDQCAITGSCPPDLLEVAYIVPFPTGSVHSPENAILLRSDLHTLWDLNQIGIDPKTMRIVVSPRLAESKYGKLAGRALLERADKSKLDRKVLTERWQAFNADVNSLKQKAAARREGSAPSPLQREDDAAVSESMPVRQRATVES